MINMRTLIGIFTIAVSVYVLLSLMLYLFQGSMVYLSNFPERALTASPNDVGLEFEEITLETSDTAALFGEDQARYLIVCSEDDAASLTAAAKDADLPLARIGEFGGEDVVFGASRTPLADLATVFRSSFEANIA